jgi:hypothetical protein
MKKLLCPLRKAWVAATPEELVRQALLHELIHVLGYPAALLSVEKELKTLPHLGAHARVSLPTRRADILCYAPGNHSLYPLLLIECKAVKLTARGVNQVTGYNHFVKAYFIAVVNHEERRFGWYDAQQGEYTFIPQIPPYAELLASLGTA